MVTPAASAIRSKGSGRHRGSPSPTSSTPASCATHSAIDRDIGRTAHVPDAVSFRVNAPASFATLTERQRGMASGLMAGMATTAVAEEYGVTPVAVSWSVL